MSIFRFTLALLIVTLLVASSAWCEDITIPGIPSSADEFVTMRNELATTPEGGAAMFIVTLLGFSQSQDLGMQFLTLALDQGNVGKGNVYKGYAPNRSIMYHVDRLTHQKVWGYLGYAYIRGATPDNEYQVSAPYTVVTSRNKYSGDEASGRVKVFVDVAGFKSRPIALKRNDNGIWKAAECSSMFLNVEPPASTRPKDDL